MEKWFNHSLDGYMSQNRELKAAFGEKLNTLRDGAIPLISLRPFSMRILSVSGSALKKVRFPLRLVVKLEEPTGPADFWVLEFFYVIKKIQILSWIYGNYEAIIHRKWKPYLDSDASRNPCAGSVSFLG